MSWNKKSRSSRKLFSEHLVELEAACEANNLDFEDEKIKLDFNASHEHLKKAGEVLLKHRVAAYNQDKRDKNEAEASSRQADIERIAAQTRATPSPRLSNPVPSSWTRWRTSSLMENTEVGHHS